MATLRRIKLNSLNTHITCTLCQGYYVEATTIIECLHTFCRTCIVRYLDTSTFCPVCEVQVHKTKPLLSLREDKTLQDVVYKLVPNLYRNEMLRRTEFYYRHPEAGGDRTEQSLKEKRHFFHVDDQISLSLEFLPPAHAHAHALGLRPLRGPTLLDHKDHSERDGLTDSEPASKVPHKRFIKCQAAVQIRLLEKFIRLKYALSDAHRVDIVHGSDCLSPELTLLDVVYTYKYTEDCPLNLQYTVIAPPPALKRKKQKQLTRVTSCNVGNSSEYQSKQQRLDNTSQPIKDIEAVKPENVSNNFEKVENNNMPLHHIGEDDNDSDMVIDEPPPLECDKNKTDLVNYNISTDTGKSGDSQSSDVNSSIESLKKFVNNAPGLSGFQSESSNITSVITPEIALPEQNNLQKISVQESISPDITATSTSSNNESQCSVVSTTVGVTYAPPLVKSLVKPVGHSAIRPSPLPNINLQTASSTRQPHISSPRVVLHRPSNVGFPQTGGLVRFNNILTNPRPVDPTKPRLGRPPNAARVAAAVAGRAIPHPILPRGPATRIQFEQSKPIIPGKVDNRGRPKKKPLLVTSKGSVTNNVSLASPLQPSNQLPCLPLTVNSTKSKFVTDNVLTSQHPERSISPETIKSSTITSCIVSKTNTGVVNRSCDNGSKGISVSPKPSTSVASKPLSVPNKVNKSIPTKPAGSASRLSSIADLLVSKQLSQLSASKNTVESSNSLPVSIPLPTVPTPVAVPSIIPQMCPGVPFLPGVNPALCAAYMSEYNNVSNWLKLSQTAAVIRDMNLQVLANQRSSPPSKSDVAPMDLSPTNKNLAVSNTAPSSAPTGLTNSLNYLKGTVANSFAASRTTTTDIMSKPIIKPKLQEKNSSSLDLLMNSKFNNNNVPSLSSNMYNHRNKNSLENFNKTVPNLQNKVESALNISRLTKCTSNNQSRISMNQVPLKSNITVPRKNGMTSSLKPSNCDKNLCSTSVLLNNGIHSMKNVKPPSSKVSNGTCGPQRSSPTPASAPSPRSIRSEPLNSVPSPKAAQSASPDSPSIPSTTISPPTPEVTITKLPNSAVSTSVSCVAPAVSHQSINSIGKITHTNTVSITKRPSTSVVSVTNKISVRSPNASVRQIPNPSLLSQKSEVRNIKNVRLDN